MLEETITLIKKICPDMKQNENMKNYTSFKLDGGFAKVFVMPQTISQLKKLLKLLKNDKYFILGNGTNTVFCGEYDGCVISLKKCCSTVCVKKNIIEIGSGKTLFQLNNIALQNNLGGIEWSYGIPASIGGAVAMNAGAYGGEIKNHIQKVAILCDNKVVVLNKKQLQFSYRNSNLKNKIILKVWLKLASNANNIKQKQMEIYQKRKQTQPLEYPSAGSVFLRNGEIIPAKIIDNLGLKGYTIGGVSVSKKHAGFFVNLGNGSASDLEKLICYVKMKANQQQNVNFDCEIIFMGE